MSNKIDMNFIAQKVKENQQKNVSTPSSKSDQIFVGKNGEIIAGDQVNNGKQLSQIHQGTFAAPTRFERELEVVREKLPSNTMYFETSPGQGGWVYSFHDEFGEFYKMFAYHNGSSYDVKVLVPNVEGVYKCQHICHLFYDARICFGETLYTLEAAYAKSVLWANGFTVFQHQKFFPV